MTLIQEREKWLKNWSNELFLFHTCLRVTVHVGHNNAKKIGGQKFWQKNVLQRL